MSNERNTNGRQWHQRMTTAVVHWLVPPRLQAHVGTAGTVLHSREHCVSATIFYHIYSKIKQSDCDYH